MTFQRRDVIADKADSLRFRVLLKLPNITWVINLFIRLAFPYWMNTSKLAEDIRSGDFHIVESDGGTTLPNEKRIAEARNRFERFEPILEIERLLSPAGRGRAYKELKETDSKLTRKNFDKGIRDWCSGGMTMLSMVSNFDNCGRGAVVLSNLEAIDLQEAKSHALEVATSIRFTEKPERLSERTSNKKGFPRKRSKPASIAGFRVDRQTLRVFLEYYQWKSSEVGRSITSAYTEMCTDVFWVPLADGSKQDLPSFQKPTLRQFKYWYYLLVTPKPRRIASVGKKNYELNERALLGNEISVSKFIGSRASGDATIWNIGIVSRLGGRRAIGCPVVYRIRCKRSGYLLGLAVTLDSASWIGLAAAIANCLEDKVKFCATYGIHIEPWEWDARGLPGELEFDRGESDNHGPDRFIAATGVNLINVMGQRPDLKGGVESDYRTLQVYLRGITPATLIETWETQKNKKWKLEAVMDLDQFTALLLTHELNKMKQMREGVLLDDKMVAAGVNTAPMSMWSYSKEYEGGGLSSFDLEKIQFLLMPRATADITPRGVYFKGIYYISDELIDIDAFSAARIDGQKSVSFAFDPRLVDYIYIEKIGSTDLTEPWVCRLNPQLEHQHAFRGKTFAEIQEMHDKSLQNEKDGRELAHQSSSKTRRSHKELVATAKAATGAARAASEQLSDSEQMRQIPTHRVVQAFADSPKKAFRPYTGVADAPAPAAIALTPEHPVVTPISRNEAPTKALSKDERRALEYKASIEQRKKLQAATGEKP